MDLWRTELTLAGRAARAEGLLNDALGPAGFASFAISASEGAIAQSELFRDVTALSVATTDGRFYELSVRMSVP
jgi:hypothetical protein